MDDLFTLNLTRQDLRRLLEQNFPTDGDFDAFLIDHFPAVKRRCSSGMDRLAKTNLLFELVESTVLSEKLRTAYPAAFAYILEVAEGEDIGRQYPLPYEGRIVIGRAHDADIRILDPSASRCHAVLGIVKGDIVVHKQGKTPIYILGTEVQNRARFLPAESLRVAGTTFSLHAGTAGLTGLPKNFLYQRKAEIRLGKLGFDAQVEREGRKDEALEHLSIVSMGQYDPSLDSQGRKAEWMMGPQLKELLLLAQAGHVPENQAIEDLLRSCLTLASATQKALWFGWLFDFARSCRYRIPVSLLSEISAQVLRFRPAIRANLLGYQRTLDDQMMDAQLKQLCSECPEDRPEDKSK